MLGFFFCGGILIPPVSSRHFFRAFLFIPSGPMEYSRMGNEEGRWGGKVRWGRGAEAEYSIFVSISSWNAFKPAGLRFASKSLKSSALWLNIHDALLFYSGFKVFPNGMKSPVLVLLGRGPNGAVHSSWWTWAQNPAAGNNCVCHTP